METLLRYFSIVLCGFAVDFSIYAKLISLGGNPHIANVIGFCIGTIINVVLIRSLVFPDSRFKLGTDVLLTILSNGAMLGLGIAILWLLIEALNINPYLAKLIANGATFILNYATRYIIFRKK